MKKTKTTRPETGSSVDQLNIWLGDQKVGALLRVPPDRILFTLDQEYIDRVDRPTLTLPLKDKEVTDLQNLLWKSNVILPPFFSNLLPEGHLRRYLADLNSVDAHREFQLLCSLGADLPGALRVEPAEAGIDAQTAALIESASPGSDAQRMRFSLGGVQLKFSALVEAAGGLTIPVDGVGGSWIVKLPSAEFPDVPENEFSMLNLARLCGIDTPECRLVPCSEIDHLPLRLPASFSNCLAVKRFDRTAGGGRIHIEDMAQVFDIWPDDKYNRGIHYNHIARLLWQFVDNAALQEFVARLVFMVATCNNDMHLKNWSLIYSDGVNPQLAPAYDLVSTGVYVGHDELALKLGNTRVMKDVSEHTFARLADLAHLPRELVMDAVKEATDKFRQTWKNSANELPVPAAVRSAIDQQLKDVPLFWER